MIVAIIGAVIVLYHHYPPADNPGNPPATAFFFAYVSRVMPSSTAISDTDSEPQSVLA